MVDVTRERVCSTIEAAKLLGVGVRTIQLWMDSGALEGWKTPGGHRRVTLASIEKMLEKRGKLPAAPSRDGRLKVLVVEDSNHLLNLYRANLSSWGLPLEIITAGDGFEGLVKLGEHKPHLLITDLKMPGLDGFDMIRSLRADPHHAELEIVVVTGLPESEISKRGRLPPDVTVLGKPVPFDKLEQLIRNRFLKRRAIAA